MDVDQCWGWLSMLRMVVKVENNGNQSISSLLTAGTQCIINIECRQRDEPAKIIQTFRAIDTGSEIKLVPADLPIKVEKPQSPPDTSSLAQMHRWKHPPA